MLPARAPDVCVLRLSNLINELITFTFVFINFSSMIPLQTFILNLAVETKDKAGKGYGFIIKSLYHYTNILRSTKLRFLAAGNLHSISSSKQVECQEHVEVNAHCVPLSRLSIQLAKVKTNGNDNSIHDHEQGCKCFYPHVRRDICFNLESN